MRREPAPCAEFGVFAQTLAFDLFLDKHEHHCSLSRDSSEERGVSTSGCNRHRKSDVDQHSPIPSASTPRSPSARALDDSKRLV